MWPRMASSRITARCRAGSACGYQLAPLVISQTSAIQLDVVQLQRLQPESIAAAEAGQLGSLPLVLSMRRLK